MKENIGLESFYDSIISWNFILLLQKFHRYFYFSFEYFFFLFQWNTKNDFDIFQHCIGVQIFKRLRTISASLKLLLKHNEKVFLKKVSLLANIRLHIKLSYLALLSTTFCQAGTFRNMVVNIVIVEIQNGSIKK